MHEYLPNTFRIGERMAVNRLSSAAIIPRLNVSMGVPKPPCAARPIRRPCRTVPKASRCHAPSDALVSVA